MSFLVGQSVIVNHGPNGWAGIVDSASEWSITVVYPGANRPGDDKPAREMINLRYRSVSLVNA